MIVALDFASGLHGHFLEFIVNKYIFGVPHSLSNIFQSSNGAVHAINLDEVYQQHKVVHRGHFSSFNRNYPENTSRVIFIQHSPSLDFVLLTNIYHRCHDDAIHNKDFSAEDIKMFHESFMQDLTNVGRRNNWYTKLSERHFANTEKLPNTALPVFKFDYASFFDIVAFCQELNRLASFLDRSFEFDPSLPMVWREFMLLNQGWTLYQKANTLIHSALLGQQDIIPDDWMLHSYINFCMSKMFRIFDGELFTNEKYPNTTLDLLDLIKSRQV